MLKYGQSKFAFISAGRSDRAMDLSYDRQGFLDKVYRRSKAVKSQRSARTALKHFESFCMERYARSDIELINEIRLGRTDVYRVLDSFVGYMESEGLQPTSISPYMSFVRGYLGYCDIEISESRFRNKVTMPVIEVDETREEGPTFEEIQRILSILPVNLRLLCMLVMTTLRRPNELLQLRVRDIRFEHMPTVIIIPASHSKNRVGRETFTTSEVTKMLRDHIKRNQLGYDDCLFSLGGTLNRTTIIEHQFRYHIRKQLPDLNTKIEGTSRYRITLYSFKDYGFTRAENLHGTPFAKYLKGDKKNPYSTMPPEEKKKKYLVLEPELIVFDAAPARKALQEDQNLKETITNLAQKVDNQQKMIENQQNTFSAFLKAFKTAKDKFGINELPDCRILEEGSIKLDFGNGRPLVAKLD